MEFKRYTVTAALPYANGPLHIGHIAGAYLPADLYVRYLRMRGRDVVFICGSDEHGAAITLRAKKEGITPKEIIDKYDAVIRQTFERFGISFDIYHRTSEPIHHETSQQIFLRLHERGEFTEQVSEQYFDEAFQQFLADRYITGTCPVCGNPSAYGDQCEKCGSSLSPTDLISPVSTLSGQPPVLKQTRHWYLPLDKYQPWLETWLLEGKKGIWKHNVYGQCSSWLKEGLQPRAMTRDLDWGVDVPLPDAEGKKLYVWMDAPIGYISATRQLFTELESGEYRFATPRRSFQQPRAEDWHRYWKDPETRLLHFIGKDNIVFHCIIFPAILHAHGEYLVPDNVPANEFLNLEGDKMSTSRNYAVWLHEYLEEFPGKEDVLRYALCSILPEQKDSDFTWKDFQARNNSELADILGNYINRVISLTRKYCGGIAPGWTGTVDSDTTGALHQQVSALVAETGEALEQFRFREALQAFMNIARAGNKYLTDAEPWKKAKTAPDAVPSILHASLQVVAKLGLLARVFLPHTAQRIDALLNADGSGYAWDDLLRNELLPAGHALTSADPLPLLFEKIDDSLIERQLHKLHPPVNPQPEPAPESAAPAAAPPEPAKPEISYEDFQRIDIRIGTILEAQRVPKADKLLQFKVDTGLDVRTILSGVAQYFTPEEMVGKQVPVLINLKPRTIRGIESQGMILFPEDPKGLHLMLPVDPVDPGAIVK
ncbi:MAG: methionine--tRNA ligase [Bacteroidia bacterium]|nr:methionine--tRNA ligase [Bacteroidia bacterium]